MSKVYTYVSFSILLLLLVYCNEGRIKKGDVVGAQKLIGVEFSGRELETMLKYLNDNRKAYDSMRKIHLDISVPPAMYFDPKPDNFLWPTRSAVSDWRLPQNVSLPASDEQIAFLTVADLGSLLQTGKVTSVQLTKLYIKRLKKYNDTLKAVITITEDLALAQAAKADDEIKRGIHRGPLHGIPYGIKDLFAVPGYKTTWGAEPYRDQVLNEKAIVVKKLEEAGAVLIAKLTSGALARGDVWFGGKTKNPWDLKQGADGSSAGSASATAAGLVGFSIGTETMGSVIAPSSRCGVTGLRPSFGSVSRSGVMTLSWSLDKVGTICRSAQDCALVYGVIKGLDPTDKNDRALVDYPFSFNPPRDLKNYKIGYFKKMFDKDTTKNGTNNVTSLSLLKSLGADLHEVVLPDSIPYKAFDIILRAEGGAFFDELVRTHRDRELSQQDTSSRANLLRQSRFISAVEYLQAYRHRKILIEKFNVMMKQYDFIVAPTEGKNLSLTTNMTGHPAIAIPNGFDKKGHPTSITLVGNLYDEGPILEAAYVIQQATDHDEKYPIKFLTRN